MEQISQFIQAAPLLPVLGTVLMGLLQCFAGYRLLRFWITLSGFGVGMIAGYTVTSMVITDLTGREYIPVVIALAAGILCGFLAYRIYLAGVFLFCGLMAFTAMASVRFPAGDAWQIAGFAARVAAFLIVGYLGMKFARPAVVLISALSGALSVSRALPSFVPVLQTDEKLQLLILVLLAAAGMIMQFVTTRGK